MSLTFSLLKTGPSFVPPHRITPVDITFDSSYLRGGEVLTGGGIRANDVTGVQVFGHPSGIPTQYDVRFDRTNKTLKAYKPTAPLRVEEAVTVTSNAGQLACVPGYILSVHVTAGSVTGAFDILPTGLTPTTTQVAVNFTTGAMTFLSGDAVTACKVTYIPLGVGPFIEANRVVDEAVVFGSGAGDTFNLANRAALIQYVCNTTATGANRLPAIQPVGESPSSNQIAIDINNSGATTITNNSGQDTNTGKVTYWKYSAFAEAFGWTDQADISVSSNVITWAEALDLGGILIPGFGTKLVGEATATNKQQRILGPSGAAATDVAVYDPAKGTITFAGGDSITTCEIPYIVMQGAQMTPTWVEVPNGEDLSTLSVRCAVWSLR